MSTEATKKVLKERIPILEEEIEVVQKSISELNMRIDGLTEQKKTQVAKKKKLEDDLKDIKQDAETV